MLLFFFTEVSRENSNLFFLHIFFIFLFQTYLNSFSREVKPRPTGCYPGALTTRLETLWLPMLLLVAIFS